VCVCVCEIQDSLELVFKQSKAVSVTSMAFPLGDVNNFVVGSEDGSVYTACRHGRCVCSELCFVDITLWPTPIYMCVCSNIVFVCLCGLQ
jgi:hypothetical protein